jgi:serine/threonine-protein kinase HipA
MKLSIFVHDIPVATLESTDNFEHVLSYHPDIQETHFVSLLMPVRTKSYNYPDLHPFFRMNLRGDAVLPSTQNLLQKISMNAAASS